MCQVLEDIRNGAARETAVRMIQDGEVSLEKIARYVLSLSIDELKKMAVDITQ